MTEPRTLADVLAALEPSIVDDESAAAWRSEVAASERDIAQAQRLSALHRAGVPVTGAIEALLADGGEDLRPTKPLRSMRRWLARGDVPPILVLSGGMGSGKSVAAAFAVAHQRGGLWRSASQIARIFAANFGEQYADQQSICNAALLVVDDLGSESQGSKMSGVLLELLEQRKRSARIMRTIISTNLGRAEFEKRYPDPRIASRMDAHAGAVAWIDCPGADLRRATQ